MIKLKNILKTILVENPDYIKGEVDGDFLYLFFRDNDAYPFFYSEKTKKTYIGGRKTMHTSMLKKLNKLDLVAFNNDYEYISNLSNSEITPKYIFSGRMLTNSRIISFWIYPRTTEIFYKCITSIEKKMNLKLLDNNWKLEKHKKFYDIDKVTDIILIND